MQHMKIQQEILKQIAGKRGLTYHYYKIGKMVYIFDSTTIYLIPENEFCLNAKQIWHTSAEGMRSYKNAIQNIMAMKDKAETYIDSHVLETKPNGNVKLYYSKNQKEVIAIAEKKLKYFDGNTTEFRGINNKSPLYLYHNTDLIGIIMPVGYQAGTHFVDMMKNTNIASSI